MSELMHIIPGKQWGVKKKRGWQIDLVSIGTLSVCLFKGAGGASFVHFLLFFFISEMSIEVVSTMDSKTGPEFHTFLLNKPQHGATLTSVFKRAFYCD